MNTILLQCINVPIILMFIFLLYKNIYAKGLLKHNRVQDARFFYVKFRAAQLLRKFPALQFSTQGFCTEYTTEPVCLLCQN